MERALIGEYRRSSRPRWRRLTPGNHAAAVALAELPDVIRGYEDVKLGASSASVTEPSSSLRSSTEREGTQR